jgi:hypothetical protein
MPTKKIINNTVNKDNNLVNNENIDLNVLQDNKLKSVCGWDIGIKNSSYCIIKSATLEECENINTKNIIIINGNKYRIHGWDVINVLPEIEKKQIHMGTLSLEARQQPKCSHKLKQLVLEENGNNLENYVYCGKNATRINLDLSKPILNKLGEYDYESYCNKHFKDFCDNFNNLNELNNFSTIDNKNIRCCYIGDDNNKCNTSKVSWIHPHHYYISYCDKHKKIIDKSFEDSRNNDKCLKIIKNKNVAQLDLTMLGCALYNKFDELHQLCDVETVLLENQPVLKNPTMKSIQMFLFSYFIMRGVLDDNKPLSSIRCYSANQKLDLHKLLKDDPINTQYCLDGIKNLSNVYSRNKKLAVLLVEYILINCSGNNNDGCLELLNFFKEHKKKDDLADSFLMTLHFLEVDNLKKISPIDNIKNLLKKGSVSKKGKNKDVNTYELDNIQ